MIKFNLKKGKVMKKVLSLMLLVMFSYTSFSQTQSPSFLRYYEYADIMQAPAAAFKFGLNGYSTPSILNYLHDSDIQGGISRQFESDESNINQFTRFGAFSGGPGVSFGVIGTLNPNSNINVYDYRYSLGFGSKKLSVGLGYGFVGGDKAASGRSNSYNWSVLYRPNSFVSTSVGQTRSIDRTDFETVVQAAVRPIPNYPLALFADASFYMADDERISDFPDIELNERINYSFGVSWEVIDGIRINGRKLSNPVIAGQSLEGNFYTVGIDLSLGNYGVGVSTGNTPATGGNNFSTLTYRSGAKDRTIFDDMAILPKLFYTTIDLKGPIKYQSNKFFDRSKSLLQILTSIDEIKNNGLIKGVLVNITGMQANPSISWEIREKLLELRNSGKKVIVFMERADLEAYHFASVADKIIMDEMGSLSPSGYLLGRSFYKNMFEKLNIGFEELRLFKYKSAVENYAREDYSEGNREQLQALVDSWYETSISEIASARKKVTKEQIDSLVNSKLFYYTEELLENGIVDKFGRWPDRKEILEEIDSKAVLMPGMFIQDKPEPFDDRWGESSDGIAVIYAVGVCAMEGGINARKLVNDVKKAIDNKSVKAIVLRVDSPGGDALASEYIANVIRENKSKKPVIVSQGMLAASGGYWLSMDGDKIVASPKTITGSIGVISAWMYDKGASKELGITTDKVQAGKYADLMHTWNDPLIGLGLPVRNLTADEKGQWEETIKRLYDDFITRVAKGRGTEKDSIHEVAQGRVWTGADGLKVGLVDEIGGLDYAIKLAKKEAGYKDNELKRIYEYPSIKAFDFSDVLGNFTSINIKQTQEKYQVLKLVLENNGIPMTLMPIEFWDYNSFE